MNKAQYPDGKLTPDDEGALGLAITSVDGRVVISFQKATAWIGMPPEQAVDLAELLINHALSLGFTRPLMIRIGGRRTK